MENININSPYQDLTPGGDIYGSGNSAFFKTGDWRTDKPIVDEDKCKNCCICVPFCPEGCIAVKDGVRGKIDLDYCKGCGICAKVCPFGAIKMITDTKEEG